ncbi:short-chain fatty acid transporter [Owenweeksia hongkongensis]|uniref:short-chain fatty acid transporter n=1 Tax=Owenweeksia hongkongensis TaxID=253245 RepID=UPI003A8DCCAA
MTTFAEKFERTFRAILPSPFTIAILLTLFTFLLAWAFGNFPEAHARFPTMLQYWYDGIWSAPLMVFAMQMMLILVLGHALALAPLVNRAIELILSKANTAASATFLVTFTTILVALFNWGLGLIFGAIIARKTAEKFYREGKPLNYPLLGAAGYIGLMVFHGGISGSAPLKAVEEGHIKTLMSGISSPEVLAKLPSSIPFDLTVFSTMNIACSIALLAIIPFVLSRVASKTSKLVQRPFQVYEPQEKQTSITGAENLDNSRWLSLLLASIIIGFSIYLAFTSQSGLSFLTPNYLNFLMLGLGIWLHGNFANYIKAIESAIGGAAGILIQFPFYFGIMGLMKSTGLIEQISGFFISISNETTFPIFTFFSAGLVNIFVPSGGGQWAIQGPIIVEAASQLNIPIAKSVMALAYGDQLTNMLQPFWALPLLAVTGLKAREILPYTLLMLLMGLLIFITVLLIF